MRNLKRALSLTLASVMLLGMMVVGSSAAGFPDVDENDNVEAIEVLNAVEVILGYDNGDFGPDDLVTRAQMAVIMAKLLNLDYQYYEATCPFTDVPEWARGYVGACYARGITSGYSATTYGPNDGITPVQAASMMMRALGYFKYSQDYSAGFEVATVSQGTDIGIFKGVGSSANTQMTRNQVAKMALNALCAEMVTFTGTPGMEVNGVVVGYRPEYTPRTSTEIKYQAIESRTSDVSGGNNLNRGQYYIQLGEELYDGKLTRKFERDEFERPSINWQYNGKEIGTYVNYELKTAEFLTGVTGAQLYDELTYTTINDNDLLCYIDGVENNDITKNTLVRSNKNDVAGSGTGVLTEVFVDLFRDEITITSINTYLAQANSDYNKANETLSLKVYEKNETGVTKIVDSAVVPAAEDVVKDQYVLVYMSGKDNSTNYDVVRLFDVEIMENSEITKFSIDGPASGKKVVKKLTTNGTEYDTNVKAFYDHGNVLDEYDQALLSDMTYNVYMDRYGNVIGVDLYEGTRNYVFITGYDRGTSHISVKTADAAAIFLDGTMDVITVNVTDTNKNIDSAKRNNSDYAEYSDWSVVDGEIDLNRWYTYTVASNGNYTLKPVKNFMFTSYTGSSAPTDASPITLNSANLVVKDSSTRTSKGYAYGEDASVYITVEAGRVDHSCGDASHDVNSVGNTNIANVKDAITGVAGVYTGAQSVKIDLVPSVKQEILHKPNDASHHSNDQSRKTAAEEGVYVYTIFDNKGFIIASVVLGEAQGGTANYILPLTGAKNESVRKGEDNARSASDDTYYWEFDAIVDGVETTLTVKSKYEDVFTGSQTVEMNKFMPVEVRYEGEYVTQIKPVDPNKVFTDNSIERKIGDMKIYDVGCVLGDEWTAEDNGANTIVDPTASELVNTELSDRGAHRLDGKIELQRRTLYVERDNTLHTDVGLALATDAKAALIQPENGKIKVNSGMTVDEALGRLADRNNNVDGKQFKGRIMAVLDGNGVAQWLVIFSDTNLITGNDPSYNDYNGNVSVTAKETGKLTVLTGSTFNTNHQNGTLDLKLSAPAWAAVNSGSELSMTATLMMDGSRVVDSATVSTSFTKNGNQYTKNDLHIFTNFQWFLLLNQINPLEHNFSVVLSDITWTNAGIRYVLTGGTEDTAITGLTKTVTKLPIGSASAVKTGIFSFDADTATAAQWTVDNPTYSISGATRGSGETVAMSGNITSSSAITFGTGGIYANGNDWVTITIGGVTAPAPSGGDGNTTTYNVRATSTYNGKVMFAEIATDPASGDIPAADSDDWKTSLPKVAEDKWVMIKATSGAKIKSLTVTDPEGEKTYVPDEITTSTGVFKFQVKSNVLIGNVVTDEPTIEKLSVAYDGSAINAKLASGTSYADNDAMLDGVKDYINSNVSGMTAEIMTNFSGAKTGLKLTNSTGTVEVTTDKITAGDSLLVIRVGSTDVVLKDSGSSAQIDEALKLGGVKLDSANVFVIVNTGTVGDYSTASALTGVASNATSAVGTTAKEIVVNGGKGYAKMANATPASASTVAGVINNAAWSVTIDASQGQITDTNSAFFLPIGTALTLTVGPAGDVTEANNNKGGVTFSLGTSAGLTATNCTVSTTKIVPAGALESADDDDKGTVTVTINGEPGGAVCTIVLTPANVSP